VDASGSVAAGVKQEAALVMDWSVEEQYVLENGLAKLKDEPKISKYVKIAATLPDKTVRDVALRCRWMTVSWLSFLELCAYFLLFMCFCLDDKKNYHSRRLSRIFLLLGNYLVVSSIPFQVVCGCYGRIFVEGYFCHC
jgi:hypothetical protein